MNIGIIPFDADPAHVSHKWRYDVLIRNLPGSGHKAEYLVEAKKYDAVIVPITLGNEAALDRLHAAGTPLIGDSVDDAFTFPYSNYLLPGRLYYQLKFGVLERRFSRQRRMMEKCRRMVAGSSVLRRRYLEAGHDSAVITDALTDDLLSARAAYGGGGPCRIAWFGNVASLHGFRPMGRALDAVAAAGGCELVLVTSGYTQGRYLGKRPRTAAEFIGGQKLPCRLVSWEYATFAGVLAGCQLGIVPVDCDSPFYQAKPAGRALLMMGLGLPVVAGPVESHLEAIREGVTGFIARTPEDWAGAMKKLCASEELRKSVGHKASLFARDNFSEKAFTGKFLQVINSL